MKFLVIINRTTKQGGTFSFIKTSLEEVNAAIGDYHQHHINVIKVPDETVLPISIPVYGLGIVRVEADGIYTPVYTGSRHDLIDTGLQCSIFLSEFGCKVKEYDFDLNPCYVI